MSADVSGSRSPTILASPASRQRSSAPRLPPVPPEGHSIAGADLDAFGLQQLLLNGDEIRLGPRAHAALRVDHPMPRDGGPVGEGVPTAADLPRVPLQSRDERHLAVGGHPAPGNL